MAKIIYPGDEPGRNERKRVVASFNAYGPYLKSYSKPYDSNTCYQQKVRMEFSHITRVWSKLTNDQVLEWNEAVRIYGIKNKRKTGFISGLDFFIQTNMNILNAGGTLIRDCPVRSGTLMYPDKFNIEIVKKNKQTDILLTFSPDLKKNETIVLSATHPLRYLYNFNHRQFRKIGVIDNSWNPGSVSSSVLPLYRERFGVDVEDNRMIGFKYQLINKVTGEANKPQYTSAECRMLDC